MATTNMIPPDKRDFLLKLKKEDVTVSLITKMFANRTSINRDPKATFNTKKPEYDTRWNLHLNKGEYINHEAVDTTVGIFLFNKLLVEGGIDKVIPNGYFNEIVNKKKFNKFINYIASGIKNEVIEISPTVENFLRDYEFWAMKLTTVFSASYTEKMIRPSESLKKIKAEMLGNAPKDAGINDMVNTRTKLLKVAADETKGDPGRAIFDSGARGSFENDFGNMFVAIGPIEDPATGKFDFVKSNYVTGISKEDIVANGNAIVNAEYPKAVGTAKGGYQGKQFNAVYQTAVLGEPGSDCGTNGGLMYTLTKDNLDLFIDQYIVDTNGKLILITGDLDSKYLNHPVKLRSPMYCLHIKEGDCICSKCAGERYYKLGIRSIGLTSTSLTGQIVNKNMKLRHNLTIEMNDIDLDKLIQ